MKPPATGDCGIYEVKTQLDYIPARIEATCWWPRQCWCCQPLEMGPCAREVSLHFLHCLDTLTRITTTGSVGGRIFRYMDIFVV